MDIKCDCLNRGTLEIMIRYYISKGYRYGRDNTVTVLAPEARYMYVEKGRVKYGTTESTFVRYANKLVELPKLVLRWP